MLKKYPHENINTFSIRLKKESGQPETLSKHGIILESNTSVFNPNNAIFFQKLF